MHRYIADIIIQIHGSFSESLMQSAVTKAIAIILVSYVVFQLKCFLCSNDDTQECLLSRPTSSLFSPPVDCSICENLTEIQYLTNASSDQIEQLLLHNHPFVVTDAASNWSALSVFSLEYFRDLFHHKGESCQFFPYKTSFRSLRHFFSQVNSSDSHGPWYVGWSNCDAGTARELRKHYDRPYMIPTDCESSKTDWIFIGTPGHGAHVHIDNVKYSSWQTQIRGNKVWTLKPPLECSFTCPKSRYEAVLKPGYTLVVDTNVWYHGTFALEGDISLSIGTEFDY